VTIWLQAPLAVLRLAMDKQLAAGCGGRDYPTGGKAVPVCDVLEQLQE